LVLHRSEVDLPALVGDVIEKVRLQWPDLAAAVSFGRGEDLSVVWADEDKVRQVLTNLVENACKYSRPQDVAIRSRTLDGEVVVEVSDSGPGIPPGDLPRLFQQFFRSQEGRPTGTGLGLWISRGIIEAHGGHLTATSDVATGSTFRFTLPQRRLDDLPGQILPELGLLEPRTAKELEADRSAAHDGGGPARP
jgi:signal transduction histidine kinase